MTFLLLQHPSITMGEGPSVLYLSSRRDLWHSYDALRRRLHHAGHQVRARHLVVARRNLLFELKLSAPIQY